MVFILRADHNGGAASFTWDVRNMLLSSSQNSNFVARSPAMYLDNNANLRIDLLFLNGKGVFFRPPTPGAFIDVKRLYSQGNYEPLITVANPLQGGNLI